METRADTYSCPECDAPMSADSSVGLCLNCAGRDLQNVLFNPSGNDASQVEQPTIPGWQIKRLLGSGGMGQLWLARANDDGRQGVIKIPIPGAADPDEIAERFETEAELLSGLEHPNILSVEDIGTATDGRLFFVTEFVEGCDLRRLMRAEKLPQQRALDIFSKVCSAIEYAHAQGVVHRDLKPSNILVASDGTVKVADFGLAKDVSMPSSDGRTSAGDGLGTPYYLAPESMRDAASADERADVFSIGVLLYELLTGSVPAGSFTKLSERCNFGRGWDSVVQGALSDLPENRTGAVVDLRMAVEKLWSREQQREQWKRRRVWMIAGCAVLLAAGLGALWASGNAPEKIPHREPKTASLESPWTNGLGMEFVPIGDLLVSVHETRLADFSAFHKFDGGSVPEWRMDAPGKASAPGTVVMTATGWELDPEASPSAPGFEISPQHPVCGITSTDAWAFCTWLTMKERAEGRIGEHQRYRLPTIFEWMIAARGEGRTNGNYARGEADDGSWPSGRVVGEGEDEFPRTGPVDAFPPNPQGIKGAGGNVAEWVLPKQKVDAPGDNDARYIGYSWADLPPDGTARPMARYAKRDGFRRTDIGFRVVLEIGE